MKILSKEPIGRAITLVGGLLFIMAVGYGLNKLYRETTSPVACSDSLLREAAPVLEPLDIQKLEPISKEVEGLSGYDRDPNCLYIQVAYNTAKRDMTAANRDLGKLENVYNPEKGFSSLLGNTQSIPDLKSRIKLVEQQIKESEENITVFPN